MAKKTIRDIQVEGKKILVRVDFNVPLDKNGQITDDTRIKAALPTIEYIIQNKGKAILFSHLGRIKNEDDKSKNSSIVCAKRLAELLNKKVVFVGATRGERLEKEINAMQNGEILMFENTRFEDLDGKKESKNDPQLGKYWASLGDIFVNDAFGTAHRAHASNVGISTNINDTVAGVLLEKEIKYIGGALEKPQHPFIAVLGGAKVSDKIEVIKNLLKIADKVLIGGAMANTFIKAQGVNVGISKVEADKLELAAELLSLANGKIVLPVDVVTAKEFADIKGTVYSINEIPEDEMALDIGPETIKKFNDIIKTAKTVIWNGPQGVFEMENFKDGTYEVATAIGNNKEANTIVGGGDSAAAVVLFDLEDKFTHISTGGGASLEYLEGKVLPGIEIVNNK